MLGDYYAASSVRAFSDTVQIIDPVNAVNKGACLYTDANAGAIVDAALDAALAAPNKQLTVAYFVEGLRFLLPGVRPPCPTATATPPATLPARPPTTTTLAGIHPGGRRQRRFLLQLHDYTPA
ncbi:hypothetical protein [Bradyrhizobium sp. NBAIM01]|uniref:hypothetical protein n=1 Tax=Bradyrhizobium sp. NBAIM01 TaxID=2793818 RepID=UPI001CD5517E|nr:hypothetical protein [Bradyrhizobium sp. NBAIM01]